jgi:hypothetical protein
MLMALRYAMSALSIYRKIERESNQRERGLRRGGELYNLHHLTERRYYYLIAIREKLCVCDIETC